MRDVLLLLPVVLEKENEKENGKGQLMYANPYLLGISGTKRQELNPGDWAIIPAWAEHQEANEGEEEVVWVIVRGPGGTPLVENLGDWGESERK